MPIKISVLLPLAFILSVLAPCVRAQTDSVLVKGYAPADSGYMQVQNQLRGIRQARHAPKPFFIWVDGGIGYSRDIGALTQATATPGANYTNGGFIGMLRIRGSRSDFISVGVEGGFQHLSSVTQQTSSTSITASLNAIPIMGIITIQDYGVQLHGSVGFYRLISTATLFGHTITSGEYDMAFMIGMSAQIDLGPDYKLLPELRFTRINDQNRSLIAFMLRLELPRWQL